MVSLIEAPDALVQVTEVDGGRMITIEPKPGLFVPVRSWVTAYPLSLIESVLRVKGPAYLCDEIMRDEDSRYVQHCLDWDLLSYVPASEFAGRRILDFGSGSGASTMVLARMFPQASLVGIELERDHVALSKERASHYGLEGRVEFHHSPTPNTLPSGIGTFDAIVFSAVYEHLLPAERRDVLALLWSHLRDGGTIFVDQTPYRWFPVELHTTGLPLLNYLPDRMAHRMACRFSKRVGSNPTWPELLRMGIRGGTASEILGLLPVRQGRAKLLEPVERGVRDRIDLWYRLSSATRKPRTKQAMAQAFRAFRALTGVTVVPTLSLAIRKLPATGEQ